MDVQAAHIVIVVNNLLYLYIKNPIRIISYRIF